MILDTPEKLFTELYKAFDANQANQILDILSRAEGKAFTSLVYDWLDLPRVGTVGVPAKGQMFAKRMRRELRL